MMNTNQGAAFTAINTPQNSPHPPSNASFSPQSLNGQANVIESIEKSPVPVIKDKFLRHILNDTDVANTDHTRTTADQERAPSPSNGDIIRPIHFPTSRSLASSLSHPPLLRELRNRTHAYRFPRACLPCVKKKIKCGKEVPVCENCRHTGRGEWKATEAGCGYPDHLVIRRRIIERKCVYPNPLETSQKTLVREESGLGTGAEACVLDQTLGCGLWWQR